MTHRATLLGRGYDDSLDPPRVRLKRTFLLGLLSAFLPGSAQALKGNRFVGYLALFSWISLLVWGGVFLWSHRSDRADILGLAGSSSFLMGLRIGLIVAAVVWLALFIDAIRLARPGQLPRGRRALVVLVATVVSVAMVGGTAFAQNLMNVQRGVVTEVFKAKTVKPPLQGRYNILLMGSDSGKDREGFRPDSMTIVSIDADTGSTVLVSLPRNLEKAPFPSYSPMRKVYPDGFNCGPDCLLNAVHTYTQDRKDLYPNSSDPGLDAQIEAIEGASGLRMNYYVMINLRGFSGLVDAVGGVEMDIKSPIAKFGHDDYDQTKFIKPGRQRLNGDDALWYARSRVQSDDFDRMSRQKCLMSAMLSQLSPQKVVLRAQRIADSSKALLTTTVPASELGDFADLALKARGQKIRTVSLVPPAVDVTNPDYDKIHQMVREAIRKSEAAAKKPSSSVTKEPTATATTPSTPDPNPTSTPDEEEKINNSDDLQAVC